MKHVYLTKESINKALVEHAITKKEAQKLKECVECQEKLAKVVHN